MMVHLLIDIQVNRNAVMRSFTKSIISIIFWEPTRKFMYVNPVDEIDLFILRMAKLISKVQV